MTCSYQQEINITEAELSQIITVPLFTSEHILNKLLSKEANKVTEFRW